MSRIADEISRDYEDENDVSTLINPTASPGRHITTVQGDRQSGTVSQTGNKVKDRTWMHRAFHFYTPKLSDAATKHFKGIYSAKGSLGGALTNKGIDARALFKGPNIQYGRSMRHWLSYTDTSLGGNFPINTAYSFTSTSDIKIPRLYQFEGFGMGRWYATKIEDNAHDIHMRFGVQKFSGPLNFFSNWFDYYAYSLAQHGRSPSIMHSLGGLVGIGIGFAYPGVMTVGFLAKLFNLLGGGKFWYVNPTMDLYWSAVDTLINRIAGEMAIGLPSTAMDAVDYLNKGKDTRTAYSKDTLQQLYNALPHVYRSVNLDTTQSGFSMNIRATVNRTQRRQNRMNEKLMLELGKRTDHANKVASGELSDFIINKMSETVGEINLTENGKRPDTTFVAIEKYLASKAGKASHEEDQKGYRVGDSDAAANLAGRAKDDATKQKIFNSVEELYSWSGDTGSKNVSGDGLTKAPGNNGLVDILMANLNDGTDWVTFRVIGTGSVSESFSNSSQESMLASTINGWAAAKKQLHFNLAGGALFGSVIESVIDGAVDFVNGAASSLGLDGLMGFVMGGKVDMPKTYSDSSASMFTSQTYQIKLRTPYGHPMAVFQDLYVPMVMILAGALPLSHGRSSYGGPFYCELYDKGRATIKNGIISSVQIERATSGVAWTRGGLPLGIDITFTVENLDTAVHMPIHTVSMGQLLNPHRVLEKVLTGNEGNLADYCATLAALDLPSQIYRTSHIARNWAVFRRDWANYWDKDNFAMWLSNTAPMNVAKMFVEGTARR